MPCRIGTVDAIACARYWCASELQATPVPTNTAMDRSVRLPSRSPVAHAAQLALELASYNFGVHEGYVFPPETQEVFPGCPETKNGYLYAREAPGLGIDLDEKLAAKFPFPSGTTFDHSWGTTRRRDGTVPRSRGREGARAGKLGGGSRSARRVVGGP